MISRLKNLLKFRVERLLLLGVHYRLLVMCALVGLVAIGGGVMVQATDAPFDDLGKAVWWAFLRLTDPGYLGDDEGLSRRVISTVVTVLGYVIFMGSLIAVLTQWLNQTIRDLERGLTPIARRNHILILGWTNRTSAIVGELMRSEDRVTRFLRRRRARGLHIVILAEDVTLERTMELRDMLGEFWNPKTITFRSGTPLKIEHLERVDFHHASVIILPGADFVYGSEDESDTRTVKTLLSMSYHEGDDGERSLPQLVTEIFDPDKVPMVRQAYKGEMEILSSDTFIARCLAQTVRHPGLSQVFREILSHGDDNEIYLRVFDSFEGLGFGELRGAFSKAILLGVMRQDAGILRPILNPSGDLVLKSNDRLVFLAECHEDCDPVYGFEPGASPSVEKAVAHSSSKREWKILILGWNHKAADLLVEFTRYGQESFEIDVLALTSLEEREKDILKKGVDQTNLSIKHYEGDATSQADLENMNPDTYDNVVMLGSGRLETQEESDAHTIVGHLVLRHVLDSKADAPNVLVELMADDNVSLFDDYDAEVLATPTMASHVLAQVALRRELNAVYEELFGPGGSEIFFRPVSDYGFDNKRVRFEQLQEEASSHGEIALGVRLKNKRVELNPLPEKQWMLDGRDELVILVREDAT